MRHGFLGGFGNLRHQLRTFFNKLGMLHEPGGRRFRSGVGRPRSYGRDGLGAGRRCFLARKSFSVAGARHPSNVIWDHLIALNFFLWPVDFSDASPLLLTTTASPLSLPRSRFRVPLRKTFTYSIPEGSGRAGGATRFPRSGAFASSI